MRARFTPQRLLLLLAKLALRTCLNQFGTGSAAATERAQHAALIWLRQLAPPPLEIA